MKFSAKEDIEAPIDAVFAMLSNFEVLERGALRRGIDVKRNADTAEPVVGLGWDLEFGFRGKHRTATMTLVTYDPPNEMVFESSSAGLGGLGGIELVALSRTRTRMAMSVELSADTLSARLLLQSLKLAKSTLAKKFKVRVADFAKDIEDRHTSMA